MRVSKEQAQQNREQILAAAANLFREKGIEATGVDSITEKAGLTHGSLYSQFGSKDALAAEAILFASAGSKRKWQRAADRGDGARALEDIVASYLSRQHRDEPGRGCVIAALGADIGRQPEQVRRAFTQAVQGAFDRLSSLMPDADRARRDEMAIAAFAEMVGALILARAVDDRSLSARILDASARRVMDFVRPAGRIRRRRQWNKETQPRR